MIILVNKTFMDFNLYALKALGNEFYMHYFI